MRVDYIEEAGIVLVYLDKKVKDKSEALREASKMIQREIIRYEHGTNSDTTR